MFELPRSDTRLSSANAISSPRMLRARALSVAAPAFFAVASPGCDGFLGIQLYESAPQGSSANTQATTGEPIEGGLLDAHTEVSFDASDSSSPGVVSIPLAPDTSGASTSNHDAGSAPPPDNINVGISAEADIPGYPTKLRGTVTHDLPEPPSLKWTIIGAPSGNAPGDLVLSEDYVANPTFVALKGGNHTVQLEARWESGESDLQVHEFSVPTTPIVLMNAAGDESSFSTSPSLIRSDGTRLITIGDQITGSASNWNWLERYDTELSVVTRAHYPTDGQPVLVYPAALSGESAEVRVATPTTNTSLGDAQFSSISPSGARVAFTNDEMNSLFTLGVDGENLHVIDTQVTFDPLSPSPPFWLDETHLSWIELTPGQSTFDMFTALDEDTPEIQHVMACSPGTSDAFVATVQLESTAAGLVALDDGLLWRLNTSSGFQCSKSLNTRLYPQQPMDTEVFEFTVSPARNQLLLVLEASDRSSSIMRMDPTTGVPTTMVAADGAHHGAPHYIANGRQIVWTRRMPPSGHPESVELWRMNVDGTRKVMLYRRQSTPQRIELTSSVENRARCSVGIGARQSRSWVGVILLGALGIARRRRGGCK